MAGFTGLEIVESTRCHGTLSLVDHGNHKPTNGNWQNYCRQLKTYPGFYLGTLRSRFRFLKSCEIDFQDVFCPRLGVSDKIIVIENPDHLSFRESGIFFPSFYRCDAVITNVVGFSIMFLVADCPVITLHDPRKKIMAHIHSGRKGILQNIAGKCVRKMREKFDSNPADVIAYFSSHLCPVCHKLTYVPFDIGNPPQEIEPIVPAFTIGQGVFHFDLELANELQLRAEGVNNVLSKKSACTLCGGVNLFSHRGWETKHPDHPKSGRFAVVARMISR